MPKYGISPEPEGMLEWEWVDQRMEKSRNYWISSTRPDGKPHAAPVWGVWLDGILYFGTERRSRKGRNLAARAAVVVHLESGDEAVIIEGSVEEVSDIELLTRIADATAAKYPPHKPEPDPGPSVAMYRLRPRLVFAWTEKDFPDTATRWEFERS